MFAPSNACGSECTNFCAPTCFNAIHRTYILDPANGHKVVGEFKMFFLAVMRGVYA